MKLHLNRKGGRVYGPKDAFVLWCLPYGQWTCADGREILFDRDYAPICQRYPNQEPSVADPKEWVKFSEQSWFYNDGVKDAGKRRIGKAKLAEWGMTEVIMADIERLWKLEA